MVQFCQSIELPGPKDPLKAVAVLLASHKHNDYWAYEHGETWYIGIGSHVSLVINSTGKQATISHRGGREDTIPVNTDLNNIARNFVSKYSIHGKIFGQVGFNYSAHMSGQAFNPGQWPLLSLMVPCTQVAIQHDKITVVGYVEDDAKALAHFIQTHLLNGTNITVPADYPTFDLQVDKGEYQARVARSISEIKRGMYTKAIPSRMVNLPERVDMPATLFHGRRSNSPARTFCFSHTGIQSTGFSPEVLVSVDHQTIFTEALAGTQLSNGAEVDPMRNRLLNDPKEVMEHAIAIKGSIRRLSHVCHPATIAVKDFMSIIPRGNVQHLFSHVTGQLSPDRDGWDALPGLVANITVPGLPKQRNLEAIECFEPSPRDLYCGAVLMIDERAKFFEAALVLRSVFQDKHRQWLQAGAGVTAFSNPQREFTETREKLGSVAPYLVAEHCRWPDFGRDLCSAD